ACLLVLDEHACRDVLDAQPGAGRGPQAFGPVAGLGTVILDLAVNDVFNDDRGALPVTDESDGSFLAFPGSRVEVANEPGRNSCLGIDSAVRTTRHPDFYR